MTGLELLNKYDKAATVVKQFYLDKLTESLKTSELPEDYKTFVKAQNLDNEQIGSLIDANPRSLFDVFDKYGYYIETLFMESMFHFTVVKDGEIALVNEKPLDRRIDCDREAMEGAMKLLNDSL